MTAVKMPGRRWGLGWMLVLACWLIGGAPERWSQLLILAIAVGIIITIYRKAWGALTIVLCLNPLSVFFLSGILGYMQGAPVLWFVGLPRIESFNLDQSTRCFRDGGGCFISGNQWVSLGSHNEAVRLMCCLFGWPSKSYHGAYPTKEEALSFVKDAPLIPVEEFLTGKIRTAGDALELPPKMVQDLVEGLRLYPMNDPLDDVKTEIQARVYQNSCIVLRLYQNFGLQDREDCFHFLILLDLESKRPFAYYRVEGQCWTRLPPVAFLSN